jgi:3',5'-cyclic AMP phosphodiesterase CpdA
MTTPRLLALSDLHVAHPQNREIVAGLRPGSDGDGDGDGGSGSGSDEDWLLLAGDVGELYPDIEWALQTLSTNFKTVVWTPGNHELWTRRKDPVSLKGQERYLALVELCRGLGIITPEDPYPVWDGPGGTGPVTIAPLFLLYDYTFRPDGAQTKEEGLKLAYDKGIICRDEALLHPDPYQTREEWCWARIAATEQRLETERDPELPVVFVTHYPLVREPTRVLRYPLFAQWCGTTRTSDWHLRFNAAAVVYGHLHIPRTTWYDGVRFEEVSLGYPREWRRRPAKPGQLRQILPAPENVRRRP